MKFSKDERGGTGRPRRSRFALSVFLFILLLASLAFGLDHGSVRAPDAQLPKQPTAPGNSTTTSDPASPLASSPLANGPYPAKNLTPLLTLPIVGDWTISTSQTISSTLVDLRGNLLVSPAGSLTLINSTLLMNVSYSGQFNIDIKGALNVSDVDGNPQTRYDASIISTVIQDASHRSSLLVEPTGSLRIAESEVHGMGWADANRGVTVLAPSPRIIGSLFSSNYVGLYVSNSVGAVINNNAFVDNDVGDVQVSGGSGHRLSNNLLLGHSLVPSEVSGYAGTWDGFAAGGTGSYSVALDPTVGFSDSSSVKLVAGGASAAWVSKSYSVPTGASWVAARISFWLYNPASTTNVAWIGGYAGTSSPTGLTWILPDVRGMTGHDIGRWALYSYYQELSNVAPGSKVWVAVGIQYSYGSTTFNLDNAVVDIYSNNAFGMQLSSVSSSSVTSSVVQYHRYDGLHLTTVNSVTISNCIVSRNSGVNLLFDSSQRSRVQDCDLSYTAGGGAYIKGASSWDVISNVTISWSEYFGIVIEGSHHYVGNSTSIFNKGDTNWVGPVDYGYSLGGLYLNGAFSNTVHNNNVSRSYYWGIVDSGGSSNTIEYNRLYWNSFLGIDLEYRVQNDRIIGNSIEGGLKGGIRLKMTSFTLVEDNVVLNTGEYGISTILDAYSSDYVQILNNTIRGAQNCLALDDELGTLVSGNEISGCGQGIAVMPYGSQPDWPMFRMSAGNQGGTLTQLPTPWPLYYPNTPVPGMNLEWSAAIADSVRSSPVVSSHRVYVEGDSGRVVAFDEVNGSKMWEYPIAQATPSVLPTVGTVVFAPTPASDGQHVVAAAGSKVVGLAAETGALLWQDSFPDLFIGSPVVAGGEAFLGGFSGKLYALSLATGRVDWTASLGDAIVSSLSYTGQGNIIVRGWNGTVAAFALSTGALQWQQTFGRGSWSSPAAVIGSATVYGTANLLTVVASLRGSNGYAQVVALNNTNGAVVWQVNLADDFYASPAQVSGRYGLAYPIYLAGASGWVYSIGPLDGSAMTGFSAGGSTYSSISTGSSLNFVVTNQGVIRRQFVAATSSGTWTFSLGHGTVSSPALAYHKLFMTTQDGGVFVFDLRDFSLTLTDNYVHDNQVAVAVENEMTDIKLSGNTFARNGVSLKFMDGGKSTSWADAFSSSTVDISVNFHTHLAVVGPTFDKSKVTFSDSGSSIRVYWPVNVSVVDTLSYSVAYPNVTVAFASNGTSVYSGKGDASGRIIGLPLEDYVLTSIGSTQRGSYNISAWKLGYSLAWNVSAARGPMDVLLVVRHSGTLIALAIAPSNATVNADSTTRFSALGIDVFGNSVFVVSTWWVENGTIWANGTFAPWSAGTWRVRAVSGNLSAEERLVVVPGRLSQVRVNVSSATVSLGSTVVVQAGAFDSKGNHIANATTTYSVDPPDLGAVDASGVFSPARAGTASITATVRSGGVSKQASVSVRIESQSGGAVPSPEVLLGSAILVVAAFVAPIILLAGWLIIRYTLRVPTELSRTRTYEGFDDDASGDVVAVCNACNKLVDLSATSCPHCGARFNDSTNE